MTNCKLNNASIRQKLNPLDKNILQKENPYRLFFGNISTFDGQNSTIRSLLSEIEIGKQTEELIDKILEKALSIKDIKIKSNLGKLHFFNRNLLGRKDDSDDDDYKDDNDNNVNNDNNNGAAAPDNLSELLGIPKQDETKMVKNEKPEIKNMEKNSESLTREGKKLN